MKRVSYFIIGGLLALLSCSDDETLIDQIESSPNLVGFHTSSQALSGLADGSEYDFEVPVKVFGPTASELQGSVTVMVSVNESSTAVEGTHFRLDSKELVLSDDGDFLGVLPITLLSEGVVAPLAETPQIILNVEQVSGNGNVVASSKPITLNLFYLCPHDLSGNYLVTIDNARCNNATYGPNFPYAVTISENADGSWHLSSADGGFLNRCTGNSTLINSGNIVVLCGEVQFSNDLDYGSLDIGTITGGSWDETTGTLILNHTQDFTANWPSNWTSTYVRQ